MNKVSRRFTIGALVIVILGAAFMSFLYFYPYQRVNYTRFANVKTDYRLADNQIEIIESMSDLENFEKKVNQTETKYSEAFFDRNVLLAAIRNGSYYAQSKVTKVRIGENEAELTYAVENDQNIVGSGNVEGVFFIDLIEVAKSKIKTSDLKVTYIDKVM